MQFKVVKISSSNHNLLINFESFTMSLCYKPKTKVCMKFLVAL